MELEGGEPDAQAAGELLQCLQAGGLLGVFEGAMNPALTQTTINDSDTRFVNLSSLQT